MTIVGGGTVDDFIRFRCAVCGKSLKARSRLVGKKFRCPCGQTFHLHGPAEEKPTAAKLIPSQPAEALVVTSNDDSRLPASITNPIGMEFVLVPMGKSWLGGGG